jgi:hypothetical protein
MNKEYEDAGEGILNSTDNEHTVIKICGRNTTLEKTIAGQRFIKKINKETTLSFEGNDDEEDDRVRVE